MERKDLLQANARIFKAQGAVLDKVAKKTVKVLVVGNPSNTNALITSHFAPSIADSQFTCLTQLDQVWACSVVWLELMPCRTELAVSLPADFKSVPIRSVLFIFTIYALDSCLLQIKNVLIWGNHSATQYPDVQHAYVLNPDGTRIPVTEAVNDDAWLRGEFVTVRSRTRC